MISEILEAFLKHCVPYESPASWRCLTADAAAFLVPAHPESVLAALAEHFPEQWLVDAGLSKRTDKNEIVFNDRLGSPGQLLMAIRDSRGGQAYRNIITAAGCLIDSEPLLFEGLRDDHNVNALRNSDNRLLLTEDVEDAVILRSLGLPAVPASGFCDLGQNHEPPLASVFGVDRPLSPRETEAAFEHEGESMTETFGIPFAPSDGPSVSEVSEAAAARLERLRHNDPIGCELRSRISSDGFVEDDHDSVAEIVFVAWSVKSLSRPKPEAIEQAIGCMRELSEHRDWNLTNVFEWVPTPKELKGIEFALAKGSDHWVTDAVIKSLQDSLVSLSPLRRMDLPSAHRSVAEVMGDLHDVLIATGSDEASHRKKREVLYEYRHVMHRQLVQPVLESIELTDDPRERLRLMQLANLAQVFVDVMPGVREEVFQLHPSESNSERRVSKIKDMLAVSQQLLQFCREDPGWKMKGSARRPQVSRNPALTSSSRFAGLDLMNKN